MTALAEPIEWLCQVPLFAALSQIERAALARAGEWRQLGSGDLLWRRSQPAAALGVVAWGRLKMVRNHRRQVIVDLAGPGDLVGEVALLVDQQHQYDVICLRRARVLLLPAPAVRSLLRERPRVGAALALVLAREVLRLTRRVETLTAGSVERRLARVLIGLAERFGEPFPGGTLVPVRLRREDLASMAATSSESASRWLSNWSRAGILLPQPAGYLVRDLDVLRKIARS